MADRPGLVSPLHVVVLMPVHDDAVSASELLRRFDHAVFARNYAITVLVVDDGSAQEIRSADFPFRFRAFQNVTILRLRRNLGHQRAIAVGLAYIEKRMTCDAVLVMDGD